MSAAVVICGPGWGGEPPSELLNSTNEDERWCFGERKRRTGRWELWGSRGPSHWEPVWVYRCDGCGQDRRLFPGWSDWAE